MQLNIEKTLNLIVGHQIKISELTAGFEDLDLAPLEIVAQVD